MRLLIISISALAFLCGAKAQMTDCFINVNGDLPDPQPLYLRPNTEEFIYPSNTSGIIHIRTGEFVDFFCSSGFRAGGAGLNSNLIRAQCISDRTYFYNGQLYLLSQLACNTYPFHVARGRAGACHDGASLVQIGFDVTPTRFLRVMDVCFDERHERTHYVRYEMIPANVRFQAGLERPLFIEGGFFPGRDMNVVYSQVAQRERISTILGSTQLGAQIIQAGTEFYLARGHLAAMADFIFGSQQLATFHFINAAPQWQIFNGNNWQRMEESVRNLVGEFNMTLEVYTGTFETLALNNTADVPTALHLSLDVNNNHVVPVPKFFYRIIIDKATRKGVALIGVNNPYVTMADIQREYILCDDVLDRMTVNWLAWNRTNLQHGYGYACEVNEFAAVVQHLPDLEVDGLLFSGVGRLALSSVVLLVGFLSRLLIFN